MLPHQFYIMHCAKPDSAMNAAGFSVRAASTTHAAMLRGAFELPAYELPMDLWAKKPNRTEAPRRLARLPGGWIVHSSYLEKDTTNRDRSYFTHAIHDPSADLLSVLRSWGGPTWATDYPAGDPKELPPPKPFATAPFIGDAAVTMFLSHSPAPETSFDVQTQPARLNDRKTILERFLNAILLASAQPEGGRNRVYVHAEPGLVALLLYAAARLLPGNIVHDLTFSTFEPAHRGLREFKLATVIGTYLGHPGKWLEHEFTAIRGFGLDTFQPQHSSPELATAIPGVSQLIELAAAGHWRTVDTVKTLAGPGGEALVRIASAIPLTQALERLEADQPTADDLLQLARNPGGMAQLQAREARVWPHIRKYAPSNSAMVDAFAPWFVAPERILDFRNAAIESLKNRDLGGCIAHWNVIARTVPSAAVAEHLTELLRWPKGTLEKLPTAFRAWLRRECQERLTGMPKEILPLVRPVDEAECETILGDVHLPPAWRSTGILVLLRKSESREVPEELRNLAAIHLSKAPPDVLAAYCTSAFENREKHPELWNTLASCISPVPLFDRLIAAGDTVPQKRWRMLAEELQPFAPNADPQWKMNGRRARWLYALGASAETVPHWRLAVAPLDGRFLVGDYSQDADWAELQQCLQSLGAAANAVPDDVRLKLWAYAIVRAILHDPSVRRQFPEEDVHRAFWAFGVPPPPPPPIPPPPPEPDPMSFDPFASVEEEPYIEAEPEEETTFRKKKAKPKKQDRSARVILGIIAGILVMILVLAIVAWPKIQKAFQ